MLPASKLIDTRSDRLRRLIGDTPWKLSRRCNKVPKVVPGAQQATWPLVELQGTFRHTVPVAVDHGFRFAAFCARAERDEQWREVFDPRVRERRGWRLVLEIEQRVEVTGAQCLVAPVVELAGPRGRRRRFWSPTLWHSGCA